ncbi:MAG: putative ATPase, partial [Frankiales bacterium]|nr:putative ATPase [Frankiales bacterium]
MTVEDDVRADAAEHGFALDPAQETALPLLVRGVRGGRRGVYLHGPPGRGKTWLVDAVLRAVQPDGVLRVHAHDLSARLQAATGRSYASGATAGSWSRAVGEVLAGVRLLVLDELALHDSDDVWMAERVLGDVPSFVITSNHAVADLHRDPRHAHHADRLRELLATRADVVACDGGVDHRAGAAAADRPRFSSGGFLGPGERLDLVRPPASGPLVVGGRELPVLGASEDAVWVGFRDLCERPTSAADYAELAARPTWVVVGVPVLTACHPDVQARFLALVDVAHDRDV